MTSIGRVHTLVVIPGRPLTSRRIKKQGAHMICHTRIKVRTAIDTLSGTGRGARSGGLIPPSHGAGLIHLRNHECVQFTKHYTRESLFKLITRKVTKGILNRGKRRILWS